MHTGILWFDNSNIPLKDKISKAIAHYQTKYMRVPDLVLVHPSMIKDENPVTEIKVRPYRPVLPGHIWIGVEDKE